MAQIIRVVVLGENGPESYGEAPLTQHADKSTHTAEGTLPQGVFLLVVGQPGVIAALRQQLASMPGIEGDGTLGYLGQVGPVPATVEPAPLVNAPVPVESAPVAPAASSTPKASTPAETSAPVVAASDETPQEDAPAK